MPTTSDRGLFVWHELNTTDLLSAENFYTKIIGWSTHPWEPNPNYKIFSMGKTARAGLYAMVPEPNMAPLPPHWLTYIGTPDVDASVRQAVELGGKVMTPAYEVPRVGRMAILQDPQGALFAVSARIERQRYREPEIGDFSWHELATTNWQTAWDFYSKLFGWEKTSAMEMPDGGGTYQMFGVPGGPPLGGMFTKPPHMQTAATWVPYAMVRDASRVSEVIREQGGALAIPPMEVPGGDMISVALDRQGAMFAVHSKKRVPAARTTKAEGTTKARRRTGKAEGTTKARRRAGKAEATTKARRRAGKAEATTKARRGTGKAERTTKKARSGQGARTAKPGRTTKTGKSTEARRTTKTAKTTKRANKARRKSVRRS